MRMDREIYLSLTGEKSHKVKIPAGQGSFSIGTIGVSKGKYDVWVDKGSVINWDAFDGFFTGAGEAGRERLPYGDWPRFLYYSGDDAGFIPWSFKRSIEQFHWSPETQTAADLTNANIYSLSIHAQKPIELILGHTIKKLTLSGNLETFTIKACAIIPYLSFLFDRPREREICRLPAFHAFLKAESMNIGSSPAGAAFDCESLLPFTNLKNLALSGNLTNLNALAKLKGLESLALRFVPVLKDMPSLSCWDNLKSFIGYNIEKMAGQALKKELCSISKEKTMDYSSVTKLREKIWFETECGMPFSSWEDENAKIASKAYKLCYKEVKKSKTETELCEAVTRFVQTINQLEGIETSEREDAWEAIRRMMEASPLEVEKWQLWFDKARDF